MKYFLCVAISSIATVYCASGVLMVASFSASPGYSAERAAWNGTVWATGLLVSLGAMIVFVILGIRALLNSLQR